jgi:ABC-type phosphate/phosphonate transport system substrate-binding protein
MLRRIALVVSTALLTVACASTSEGVSAAVSQPLRDLSIVREEEKAALSSAVVAPYADPRDCASGVEELAELDAALGPDIDKVAAAASNNIVQEFALDAVRGAVSLPYRGIVRRVTGAHRRDQALSRARFAGALRRAYLKGFSNGARCPAG